jgi:urea transporter
MYFDGSHQQDFSSQDHLQSSSPSRKGGKSWVRREVFSKLNATMPWIRKAIASETRLAMSLRQTLLFIDLCLRGVAQVFFQNNPFSGLLILIGLFLQSSRVAVHGLIAVVCGNLISLGIGFDHGLINSGLFGYNSILVGLAIATFDPQGSTHSGYNAATIIASAIFSCFSSVVFVTLGKILVPYKSPPLTLPFNIATCMYLLATANMMRDDFGSVIPPALPDYSNNTGDINTISAAGFFQGSIRGVGQVYLANEISSGILILAGIAVCSRIGALAAFGGSMLGAGTALAMGVPVQAVEQGMFGFNASLSATAMLMFFVPSYGALIFSALAAVMTVFAQQALATVLQVFGLPFMTLPFCIISLPFIILQGTTSLAIAMPLASLTVPEDHLKRVNTLFDGFIFLREAIQSHQGKASYKAQLKSAAQRARSKKTNSSLERLSSVIVEQNKRREEARSGSFHRAISMRGLGKMVSFKGSLKGTRHSTGSLGLNASMHSTGVLADFESENFMAAKNFSTNFNCFSCGESDMPEQDDWVLESAGYLFSKLDYEKKRTGHLSFKTIIDAIRAAGLSDTEGLHFASLVLHLMDVDDSGTIDMDEFVAFCLVSVAAREIRRKIGKFTEFVDLNGDGEVTFDESDGALQYLGRSSMPDGDKQSLLAATGAVTEDEDLVDGGLDVVELVNFVTVAKIKLMCDAYHGNGEPDKTSEETGDGQ